MVQARIEAHEDHHVSVTLPEGHPLNYRNRGVSETHYFSPDNGGYVVCHTLPGCPVTWRRYVCTKLRNSGPSLRFAEGDILVDIIRREYRAAMQTEDAVYVVAVVGSKV